MLHQRELRHTLPFPPHHTSSHLITPHQAFSHHSPQCPSARHTLFRRAASIHHQDVSSPPTSRGQMGGGLRSSTVSPASSEALSGRLSGTMPGAQRIVVFVSDNEVSNTAVDFAAMFARPGVLVCMWRQQLMVKICKPTLARRSGHQCS